MRPLACLVLACLLALSAPAAPEFSAAGVSAVGDPAPSPEPQTSDGVRGWLVTPLPRFLPRRSTTTETEQWQVSPGVRARTWRATTARGAIRAHLLTIAWQAPGVSFAYLNAGEVRRNVPVSRMVRESGAVAGVNGDFFDIGRTGAPLGVGVRPGRGLYQGRLSGWNSAFSVTASGRPRIGTVVVRTVIRQRPRWVVSGVNRARVAPEGIAVYTPRWGEAAGNLVTDGPQRRRRVVLVRDGRVVRTSTRLPSGARFPGRLMLVGRGDGADRLARFRVGDRLSVGTEVSGGPQLVIGGSQQILDDGRVLARDDRELHPRTAVGIDAERRRVLLLVVDGRQEASIGATLVELARLMRSLGAEDALNLDGGGSSTMLALGAEGGLRLVNSPSGGRERQVANALGVRYREPR